MTAENETRVLTIKELPLNERPREKMLKNGPAALSDAELLAILLRTGTKQDSAIRLAEKLLKMYENKGLGSCDDLSLHEMGQLKGIGPVKAITVAAAIELGKRLNRASLGKRPVIRKPQEVADFMMAQLRYETKEHFILMILSTKNHVLATPTISTGSLNASVVHPREVFREVIHYPAAAVILVHNHPSGDPTPSQEDIVLTKKLVESGKILDISVLDHVIIGDSRYVSLKEQGIIQ